jgi:HD-GYP domain-containing protein (c-di-GMP phosphodiesterase class II)
VAGSIRDRVVPLAALLGACAVVPAALIHFLGRDQVQIPGEVHFLPIAVSAGLAAAASVALTVVGARRGDGRSVIVGTAFSAMAAMLAVHGLTTPGMLVEDNGVIAFSGAATLPIGGAVLALATVAELRGSRAVRLLLWIQGALLGLIVALGAAGILWPALVPSVPRAGSPAAVLTLVLAGAFYLVIGLRAARTFLLTRRRADLLVVLGTVVLAVALVPALLMTYMDLGWWLGHLFELVGIGMIAVPVALDLHRGAQSRPLTGDLRSTELVSAADAFLGPTVRALLARLAEKDAYTAKHTHQVALRAVRVGEELDLPPSRLRELAIGALLHDIGKLSVPDAILQKPASLSDEEYAVIRRHPEQGHDLVLALGFSGQIARLVRDHHERLDGAGYPHGRREAELDLETRILTACDVLDALLSDRVYRQAWELDRALALLRDESGAAFDPGCVDALERVLRAERDTGGRAAA